MKVSIRKLLALSAAVTGISFAISASAEVTTTPLLNPEDDTDVWGEKIEGLGDDGNETALVFTKTGETMNWTLPTGVKFYNFLVVGGGGGGGGFTAGGGGGGGGVVTGVVNSVETYEISVTVGDGGEGGKTNGGKGANGEESRIAVSGNPLVVAYGGGGGAGKSFNSGTVGSGGGGNGGTTLTGKSASKGYFDETKVTAFTFGNKGGNSKKDSPTACAWSGAGGGGATEAGVNVTADVLPADGKGGGTKGGEGLTCDITGVPGVYGSGGGGGASNTYGHRGYGGTNAGNGVQAKNTSSPRDGVANFGGGGGGGGANDSVAKGGNGGSGIVVIRYRVMAANEVIVPTIAGTTYNGELQTADISDGDGYIVAENAGGVNAGDYDVILTLAEGFQWVGGSTEPANLTFTIAKAANSWETQPSLSKTSWELADDPATVDAGVALSGAEVVVTYDDGETTMPLTLGAHTAVFTVAESQNHLGLSATIGYTIGKNTNSWTVEPSLTKTTWAFDEGAGAVIAGEAMYGAITVTYDDDPEITVIPNAVGEHTVKFEVAAGDTYTGLRKTIGYSVTKKVNSWVTPAEVVDFNIEDPVPAFVAPTAKYGVVTFYYDGDPSVTDRPSARGNHTVTYRVDEGIDYSGIEQTFSFAVTYKMIIDPDDASNVFGYRIPGLGANQDEVALVFTNTAAPIAYTLPQAVTEISYLVVGGGASGGASGNGHGGGGGGAGGVTTNEGPLAVSSKEIVVSVGNGGASTALGSKGNRGVKSTLTVDGNLIEALPGAGGGNASAGLGGASTYACGGGAGNRANGTKGEYLAGGVGATSDGAGMTTIGSNGGGGGGAGGSATDGVGGIGVPVTIFGDTEYYIAGGGSGSPSAWSIVNGSVGGGGYGNKHNGSYGAKVDAGPGTRWGAGGGGGANNAKGGAGYQGVVVVRYVEPAGLAMVPVVRSKVYTGETQTADIADGIGYTVTENDGGTDVGDYDVVLTLEAGYSWDGGSTDPTNLVFSITQAQNEWLSDPAISKDRWFTTEEPGVLTAGTLAFGGATAAISRNGSPAVEFDGSLPTVSGSYVITYTAPETTVNVASPEDMTKTVAFDIISGNAVAKVGEYDMYDTVAEAFAAAQEGDTILILADASMPKVDVTKSVTLVLDGHTLSVAEEGQHALFTVKNGATLTIDGTAENSTLNGAVYVGAAGNDGCALTINGGTYNATKIVGGEMTHDFDDCVIQSNGLCSDITITATDATFNSTDDTFYLAAGGTYRLTNCTINGATGIYLKGGDLTLTGCTVAATGAAADPVANGNGAISTGDGIIVDAKTGYTGNVSVNLAGKANVITSANGYAVREAYTDAETTALNALAVSGGTLTGAKGAFAASEYFDAALASGTATSSIAGGRFSHEIEQKYLAKNRRAFQRADGSWGTSPLKDETVTSYTWVGGAAGDWYDESNWTPKASETVAGIPDSDKARVIIPGTVTINIGGASVDLDQDLNTPAFEIDAGAVVTLTNGTIALPTRRIKNNRNLRFMDGGKAITDTEALLFPQNGYDGVLELAGNATVQGGVNTSTYDSEAHMQSGNTILVSGENNMITGSVMNQTGRLLVDVRDGSLAIGSLDVWGGGSHPLELSVSNATVTVGSFGVRHAVSQSSHRRKFDVFVPAEGLDAAPIKVTTKYDMPSVVYFELTAAPSFMGGKIPLISGIKSIPDPDVLASHCTVRPSKRFSKVKFSLENNVLSAKLSPVCTMLFVQ